MCKAEEILKESLSGQNPDIKFHSEKGKRTITVNGGLAFVQANGERGLFVNHYATLTLPP